MRPCWRWWLAPVLVVLASSGCIHPGDVLEPESDVVSVLAVVVAGRSDVLLVVGKPHGSTADPPPDIAPRLIGPSWEAAFSEVAGLEDDCRIEEPQVWPGSVVCLRAKLPEPIRERTRYMFAGTGPAGPISGIAVVPSAPVMVEPVDGQRLTPQREGTELTVRIGFETDPDVAMLQTEVIEAIEILSDGTEAPVEGRIWVFPYQLDVEAGVDDIVMRRAHWASLYQGRPLRLSLRLLGFEQNYANFIEVTGNYPLRQPWPSFGLEGAFGYFGAAAPSEPVRVVIKPPE